MRFAVVLLAAFALLLVEGQRRVCQPGSVFRRACNTCRCNLYGTDMACTRKQCVPDFYDYQDSPPYRKICQPGSYFKMDCNDCKCNNDGTNAACTLKGCPH